MSRPYATAADAEAMAVVIFCLLSLVLCCLIAVAVAVLVHYLKTDKSPYCKEETEILLASESIASMA